VDSQQSISIGFDAKRLFHNHSGLGNYARDLIRGLYQMNPKLDIHLFTPKMPKDIASFNFFLDGKFKVHTNDTIWPDAIWRTYFMSKEINRLKLDVFHGLSQELPFGIDQSVKKIVTIHDLIYETNPKLFPFFDTMAYKLKYKSACERSDIIIAISNHTKKDIVQFYGHQEKIKTAYQSCHQNFQREKKINNQQSYYLFVGTINNRKRLIDLVDAYIQLPPNFQNKVHVVGSDGGALSEVKSRIEKVGLQEHFLFLGNTTNEKLIVEYDHALCTVLPSIYEGFGIPIIESLFRKCPVITSNVSALPEALGTGGILIDPLNVDQLKEALITMNDPVKRDEYSQKGYQYVQENFTTVKITERLMSIYLSKS
jgi:glycosyltransferase involved in cell wall biosynthesis